MKFAKWGDRDRKAQHYDKEKITITKAGKTYNVYDAIQAANIDTDIYKVMEKYHMNQDEAVELMNERGGEKGIYTDITNLQNQIKDMGDIQRIAQEAQAMFEQLPANIKSKYGNDLQAFLDEQKKKQEQPEKQPEKQPEGEKVNETK